MKCPGCKQNNSSGADFCRKCGAPVTGGPSYEELQRALTEALDQQTATSEILRVISRSPTDVQPIFETVVERAVALCNAEVSLLTRFDGEWVHLVALRADPRGADGQRQLYPARPSGATASLRAIRDRSIVHLSDILEDPENKGREAGTAAGFRAALSVPMLREGSAIGSLTVGRPAPGRFSDKQIALLQTFADQAVIAIENVRLFTELEEKNRALTQAHAQVTEALEQQTATSEILRVISSSPTDLQPVLDAIAENAARVCNARDAVLFRLEGDTLRIATQYGSIPSSRVEQPLYVHRGGLRVARWWIDRRFTSGIWQRRVRRSFRKAERGRSVLAIGQPWPRRSCARVLRWAPF